MAYGDYIWEVRAYYDGNLRGLADDFATDDWEEVKDKVHEYISDGHVVEIRNSETGVRQVWDYDGYFEDFEGESPLFYDDFYAREDEKEFNKNYDFGSFKGESILSDYEYIHRKLGDEIWNALDEYCEMMNGELFLSDVLYKESEWKRFEKWFEKTYKKSIQDSSKYYGESRVSNMKLNLTESYGSGKWENYGDVNFLDGGFIIKDLGNGEYDFVACNVVYDVDSDHHYLIEEGTIDINDSWIDVDEIERFADCKKDEEPEWFARACVDYYGAENFGANVPRRGLEDYDDFLYTAEGVEDYMKDYDLPSEIYFDGD